MFYPNQNQVSDQKLVFITLLFNNYIYCRYFKFKRTLVSNKIYEINEFY
jgi:hypothetical protein